MAKIKFVPNEITPGWWEILGYSNYLASKSGYIKNKKTGNSTVGSSAGHYLKVLVLKDGDVEPKLQYTHILVCTAFKGEPKKGEVVLHKDDNKMNVEAKNLSWGTQSKNIKDVYKSGLKDSSKWK